MHVAANLPNNSFFIYKNGDPTIFQQSHWQYLPQLIAQIPRGQMTQAALYAHYTLAEVRALIQLHQTLPNNAATIGGQAHSLIIDPNQQNSLYQSITGLNLISGA